MKLRDILRIDLAALLRGRLEISKPVPTVPVAGEPRRRRRIPGFLYRRNLMREQILVTDKLRQLVACNVPLAEGLRHAAIDCPNPKAAARLRQLAQTLDGGEALSRSLRQVPRFCPKYYVDLVAAAEESGRLEETLFILSQDLEEDLKTRHQLRNRAVYVLLVLGIAFLFAAFLHIKVFPVFDDMSYQFGLPARPLPFLGKWVFGAADALRGPLSAVIKVCSDLYEGLGGGGRSSLFQMMQLVCVFTIMALALLAILFTLALVLKRAARAVFNQLPVVRRAMFQSHWSHALRILSMMLDRGIPLDRALEGAAAADVDRPTRRVLQRMANAARAGTPLTEALEREGRRVPRSLSRAVAFGGRMNRLPELLGQLSHLYRLRSERTLRVVLDIAFPLAIIGCGFVVASINTRFFIIMSNIADSIANST